MPARHFWRLQHNCASTGPPYGTTTSDRMAFAIGCFQPGTFLWGHAHAEALSKVTADGKHLPSIPDLGLVGIATNKPESRQPIGSRVVVRSKIALDAML